MHKEGGEKERERERKRERESERRHNTVIITETDREKEKHEISPLEFLFIMNRRSKQSQLHMYSALKNNEHTTTLV